MENLKEIKPIADFNWDEFEQGEAAASASRKEQEAAYDNTLNKVKKPSRRMKWYVVT